MENVPKLKEMVDKGLIEVKIAEKPFRETATPHYMVIDGKTVRIESYHDPLMFDNAKHRAFGIIWKNYPYLAHSVECRFEELWEK